MLSYPSTFSPLQAPSPQVVLLLRPPTGFYPTINIILQGGNPEVESKTVEKLKADVVDSYRAVGLYDAEVLSGEKRDAAERKVFFAKIAYKQRDATVYSGVYIIPSNGHYFVLTLIDAPENFDESYPVLQSIVSTLHLKSPPPALPAAESNSTVFLWFSAVGALLVFVKIGVMVFSPRKSDGF